MAIPPTDFQNSYELAVSFFVREVNMQLQACVVACGRYTLTANEYSWKGALLREGLRADRDHGTRWLHWWYRKLQLCFMLL